MIKRLQVILQDLEHREIQRAADAQRLTIAAWVRQALVAARRRELAGDVGKKLDAVRAAVRHSYPTADINVPLIKVTSDEQHPIDAVAECQALSEREDGTNVG